MQAKGGDIETFFRAIDALELVDEGSMFDRLNRMEKRRIIAMGELVLIALPESV